MKAKHLADQACKARLLYLGEEYRCGPATELMCFTEPENKLLF